MSDSHPDFWGRMNGGHLKTAWLGAPGTQRPCLAMSCMCQHRGAWVLGCANMYGVCGGCLWCGAVGSSGTRARCGAQASPRQLQEVQDCQGQLQISQAGVKCLCCFFPPLLSLPALPKINNCVNSGVIVLGQQPPRLPGLGRCWQGLLEPHTGSRLGLAARAAG